MILFLDTEFTGLGHRWPRLISIGLVSEDGAHWFYAELPQETYLDKCESWVLGNVLPLLNGGKYLMQPEELRKRLTAWLDSLGDTVVVSDAPGYDFNFLRAILRPWPCSVDGTPVAFDQNSLWSSGTIVLDEGASHLGQAGRKAHHALNDANDLRDLWVYAKGLAAFRAFAEQLASAHPHPDLQALAGGTP
ncbi:MAG: 3'-5' exoribonuclease [Rhodocyclaceae bacterium]|nr:3'-5' exoribonuclease [Rhodocyclaceae bacterium]